MKAILGGVALLALAAGSASAQEIKVAVGISGWTGFAPLTLAKEAGIFKKNGLDVTIKKVPQASRHLAIQSGDIQCAATTVETWIVWNANGVATKQIFQLDKSYGADGMVVRNDVNAIKDIKGKTVAASAPGTSPYFALAWMLKKNGLSVKDVTVVNMEPGPAAQAFIAGQNDVAMTYEPYLSSVRAAPQAGKIIATTLDYPMVMDTFGCTPKFLADNPKAAKALTDSYFEAIEMISKNQAKAYEIMGADVKQTGEAFGKSAQFLRWQDRAANKKFFEGEFKTFSNEAADLLLEIGVIKQKPEMNALADTSFIPSRPMPGVARGAGPRLNVSFFIALLAVRRPGGQDGFFMPRPLEPVGQGARVALGISFFVIFVAAWSLATLGGFVSRTFLADPITMMQDGWLLLTNFGFLGDIGVTIWRVVGGFIFAAVFAVPIGVLMGAYKPFEAFLEPFISFARYLPASAFVPLLILWAGIGELQKLLVIFIGSFFQIILMVAVAVGNTRRDLIEAAYTLGSTDQGVVRRVLIPANSPEIAEILRLVLGWAWTYVIVAELIGSSSGIGHMIIDSQALMATGQMIFGIIVIGIIGLISDFLFKALNRALFPWRLA